MNNDGPIDCDHFESAAWLLISGELNEDVRGDWERHMTGCDDCARLVAERRRVLDLYDGLAPDLVGKVDVSRVATGARVVSRKHPLMALAAALLLALLGALVGFNLRPGVGENGAALRDVERRLDDLEVQLTVAEIDRPTAAERLKAATASVVRIDQDPRIIDSLMTALATDPSPNVRMAVIDALYSAGRVAPVEKRFGELLDAQDSPLLRVALIELAADRRLEGTLDELRRVAAETSDSTVRDRARWAIGQLSRGV